MTKPRILVIGSSNMDIVVRVPRIPKPGETILGGDSISVSGGKGANQAVGAGRAGGDATFITRVGDDMFGKRAVASLRQSGIRTNRVIRDSQHPTGVALIFVADDGQNAIAVAAGANGHLSVSDVEQAAPAFSKADMLLIQLEIPLKTVMAAVKLAAQHGVPVMLNPAPAQPLADSLLECVSILTPNESEIELLTGIQVTNARTAALAADKLRSRGPRTVVVTMGARGAFLADAKGVMRVPGFRVKAVDTTAAGDVFNGALAVALAEGCSTRRAVRFANAAAALSVTRVGAQHSAPTRTEIDRFLRGQERADAARRSP